MCVGDTIAVGMNLMFDTTRFTPDFIPMVYATLATVGRYFKSSQTNNNRESSQTNNNRESLQIKSQEEICGKREKRND